MKSLLKNSILSLFSACLLTACNEHTVYHSYQSLPNEEWGKSDTLSFQIPITDSVPTTLRLFAEVRNSIEYPYHDLHLFISQILRYGALIPLLSAWLTLPEDGRDTDGEAFTNRKLLLHLFALYILQIILLKL